MGSPLVLCSATGKELRTATLSKMVANAMARSGVPVAFEPKSIRGAAASAPLDLGRWADKVSLESIIRGFQGRLGK